MPASSILHDRELTGQVCGYDPDGDVIIPEVVSEPSNGRLYLYSDGRFTYTPRAGFTGRDSFSYRFRDAIAAGPAAMVAINVDNNEPIPQEDEYYVLAGSAVRGNVLDNDYDIDLDDHLWLVKVNNRPLGAGQGLIMMLNSGARLEVFANGDLTHYAAPGHTGKESFTYTVTDGVAEVTATVDVWTAKVRGIESLTFSGGHDVYKDPVPDPTGPGGVSADTTYDPPHWQDTNLDGVAERSWPYAYSRSRPAPAGPTKLTIEARFVLDREWKGGEIWVKADGPDGIRIDPVQVAVDPMDRTKLDLPVTVAATAFPDVVKAYVGANLFTLNWQATSDAIKDVTTWTAAGTTKNPLYLTFADPVLGAGVNLYHTLVHLGSKNAEGKASESEVISAIWSDFTDRDVRRVDGTQLRYWHMGSATAVNTRELLAHANGQCGSWAEFLIDIYRAVGVHGARKYEVFNADQPRDAMGRPAMPWRTGMLVKNWEFQAVGGSPGTSPYTYVLDLDDPTVSEVKDREGIPGQGNPNPPGGFANHFIVRLGGKYYDPSYGAGPYATESEWKNAALDGLVRVYPAGLRAKKNDPAVQETFFLERG